MKSSAALFLAIATTIVAASPAADLHKRGDHWDWDRDHRHGWDNECKAKTVISTRWAGTSTKYVPTTKYITSVKPVRTVTVTEKRRPETIIVSEKPKTVTITERNQRPQITVTITEKNQKSTTIYNTVTRNGRPETVYVTVGNGGNTVHETMTVFGTVTASVSPEKTTLYSTIDGSAISSIVVRLDSLSFSGIHAYSVIDC